MVKNALQEVVGAQETDEKVRLVIHTDSDAARGMLHRHGCGRVRHLQTRYLWHQQALRERVYELVRCNTKEHPADLGTKQLERQTIDVGGGFSIEGELAALLLSVVAARKKE